MTKDKGSTLLPIEHIPRSILILRGQRVLLDRDLAALYGVETRCSTSRCAGVEVVFPQISSSNWRTRSSRT